MILMQKNILKNIKKLLKIQNLRKNIKKILIKNFYITNKYASKIDNYRNKFLK